MPAREVRRIVGYADCGDVNEGFIKFRDNLHKKEYSKTLNYSLRTIRDGNEKTKAYRRGMCEALGITVSELKHARSGHEIALARRCISYFMAMQFQGVYSMSDVGEMCGYRYGSAHTSIIRNNKTIFNDIETNHGETIRVFGLAKKQYEAYNEADKKEDVWIGLPFFPVNFKESLIGRQ